jgi:hypothetical protein
MAARLQTLHEYLDRAESIGMANVGELGRQATRFVAGGPGARRLRAAFSQVRTIDGLREQVATAQAALASAGSVGSLEVAALHDPE